MDSTTILIVILFIVIITLGSSSIVGSFAYTQSSQSQSSQPSQSQVSQPSPSVTPKKSDDNIIRECYNIGDQCNSYWKCNVNNLNVDNIGIWWGHNKDTASWACNQWVKECNGNCVAEYTPKSNEDLDKMKLDIQTENVKETLAKINVQLQLQDILKKLGK